MVTHINEMEKIKKEKNSYKEQLSLMEEEFVKERQQLLEMLKTNNNMVKRAVNKKSSKDATPEEDVITQTDIDDQENIPEWEKKLAKLEKNK